MKKEINTTYTEAQKDAAFEFLFAQIHVAHTVSADVYQRDQVVFKAISDATETAVVVGPKGGIIDNWVKYK